MSLSGAFRNVGYRWRLFASERSKNVNYNVREYRRRQIIEGKYLYSSVKDYNKYDLLRNARNEVFSCHDLSIGTSRTVKVNFRQLHLLILSLVPKNQSTPLKRNDMSPTRYIVEVHRFSIIVFALIQIIRKGFLRLHTGVKLFQAKDFFFVLSTDNLSWFTDSDVSETDDPFSLLIKYMFFWPFDRRKIRNTCCNWRILNYAMSKAVSWLNDHSLPSSIPNQSEWREV